MDQPSGRFVVRVPPRMHEKLRALARARGVSLNRVCADALGREVESGARPPRAGVFDALVASCRSAFPDSLEGVVLFGSMARGDETASSDADLLLVMRPDVPIRRRLYDVWDESVGPDSSVALGREVTPQMVALPPDASKVSGLWLEVSLDGIVLWDRDGKVSDLLRRIRLGLASGRVRREVRHGHPYWVRVSEE